MTLEGIIQTLYSKAKKKLGIGLLVASSLLPGCYAHSMKDAPRPRFENEVTLDTDWTRYIKKLHERCDKRETKPLDDQEKIFHRYIRWMNKISGKNFDVKRFDIVSDNIFKATWENGVIGLFMPMGIYWFGDALVRNSDATMRTAAHEIAHDHDPHLSYWDYITSNKAVARMDAVAEAYEHYIGLELIRAGNETAGKDQLFRVMWGCVKKQHKNMAPHEHRYRARKGIEEVVDHDDEYHAARCIANILMNEFKKMGKVWYWLTMHDTDAVYKKVNSIVAQYPSLHESMRNGYTLIKQERDKIVEELKEKKKQQDKQQPFSFKPHHPLPPHKQRMQLYARRPRRRRYHRQRTPFIN